MDFGKRQQRPYTPLMISGTPVERVSSFKYLGVNISEDLTWTAHIQTQVKKARQRLYHLRQLRKFRVSPAILKTFYSGAIEIVLTFQFTKKVIFLVSWSILICWDSELVFFFFMWAKIITIKRTKDLNYFSLCALNLFNTRVSQFQLNYWNKLTFPRHFNLLRCTCIPCTTYLHILLAHSCNIIIY